MASFSFDPYSRPGVVMVMVEGHPSYIAESFVQAEAFVARLLDTEPIALPAPNTIEAFIARVVARISSK
jgi:hypothetical protein